MLVLALTSGYKLLWPLFGSTNQLLAALTLIAASVWLHQAGRKSWFTIIPAVVMIITTIASLTYYLVVKYIPKGNILLAVSDIILLILAIGVIALSLHKLFGPSRARPESPVSA